MATKTKKSTTAKKKMTSAKRASGPKGTVRKGTVTQSMAKTARAAKTSPIGKAAAKVLAGAAAGAVRAIIPQLEEAAGAQEKVAGNTESGSPSQARKFGSKA